MTDGIPTIDPEFADKLQLWRRCLTDSDANSVFSQIYRMIWDAAAYRMVLTARELATRDKTGMIEFNGLTHRLLDRCFYQSQVMTIRRLMDRSPLQGNKGVFSLASLITDLEANCRLFSRRNLCAAHAAPLVAQSLPAVQLHEAIDVLAGVSGTERSDDDIVSDQVFKKIKTLFDNTEVICQHVNKYIAHAATPESREILDTDVSTVPASELWRAHEIICRTADFVDCFLLSRTNHTFLPVPVADTTAFADRPLVNTDQLDNLREAWAEYDAAKREWGRGNLDWVLSQ